MNVKQLLTEDTFKGIEVDEEAKKRFERLCKCATFASEQLEDCIGIKTDDIRKQTERHKLVYLDFKQISDIEDAVAMDCMAEMFNVADTFSMVATKKGIRLSFCVYNVWTNGDIEPKNDISVSFDEMMFITEMYPAKDDDPDEWD